MTNALGWKPETNLNKATPSQSKILKSTIKVSIVPSAMLLDDSTYKHVLIRHSIKKLINWMKLYKIWYYIVQKYRRLLGNWRGEFNNPLAVVNPSVGSTIVDYHHSTPTRGANCWAESSQTPAAFVTNQSLYASCNFLNQKAWITKSTIADSYNFINP